MLDTVVNRILEIYRLPRNDGFADRAIDQSGVGRYQRYCPMRDCQGFGLTARTRKLIAEKVYLLNRDDLVQGRQAGSGSDVFRRGHRAEAMKD